MKKLIVFIIKTILELFLYFCILAGFFGTLAGFIGLIRQDGYPTHPLSFLVGGIVLFGIGLGLTYLAVERNKQEFKHSLLGYIILTLLPPW
jgi:multisubunit Na+/H+ antiporter MnhG subunit